MNSKLDRLDEGHGIEAAMVANNGHWHKLCASIATLQSYRELRRGQLLVDLQLQIMFQASG